MTSVKRSRVSLVALDTAGGVLLTAATGGTLLAGGMTNESPTK